MTTVLLVVFLLATAAVLCAGVFFTIQGFRAADHPPADAKPGHPKGIMAQLTQFFEGKPCTACSRPIPSVYDGELRPGLLNASTHEAIAWDDIPAANLSTTLESHVPICSNCLSLEMVRRQHPELAVDRHRPVDAMAFTATEMTAAEMRKDTD